MSDDMEQWHGPERRREIHVSCAKEGEWGDLKATLRGILESQKRMETKQELAFKEIFGNGHDGLKITADRNKQALKRAWWWLGGLSLAVVLAAIDHVLSG